MIEAFGIYGSLFASAFLAATLLPGGSEIVLVGMIATGTGKLAWLFLAAWTGNVLGATTNWLLGRGIASTGWVQKQREQISVQRAQAVYDRWGAWSLLLSWAPVIGDGLCLLAGVFRLELWKFMLMVSLAKGARYAVVIWLTLIAT
ncbi:MAG: YqaA family protein [Alphaproteobacteria bacterium]